MSRIAAILRLTLFLALAGVFGFSADAVARKYSHDNAILAVALADLPPEAQDTLRRIQRGGPFPFPHKDGSTFGNFENRLPPQTRGYYHEYTVPTPGRKDRGARRIIAGNGCSDNATSSGEYYYTDDHYRSFRRIREP